ncbi:hypothetical protein FDECE_12847 [Fusarium decemcellulare]|nr:hypothetical protein FDECE_12847 [Fusarium decemcellulare]
MLLDTPDAAVLLEEDLLWCHEDELDRLGQPRHFLPRRPRFKQTAKAKAKDGRLEHTIHSPVRLTPYTLHAGPGAPGRAAADARFQARDTKHFPVITKPTPWPWSKQASQPG